KFEEHKKTAKFYLKTAAEALEYMAKSHDIDKSLQDEIIFNSILAYYISGNYASSYVLTKENKNELDIPITMDLIFQILNKNIDKSRVIVLEALNDDRFNEDKLLEQLQDREIDMEVAIERILSYSIFRIVNYWLNFIKLGDIKFFEKSSFLID